MVHISKVLLFVFVFAVIFSSKYTYKFSLFFELFDLADGDQIEIFRRKDFGAWLQVASFSVQSPPVGSLDVSPADSILLLLSADGSEIGSGFVVFYSSYTQHSWFTINMGVGVGLSLFIILLIAILAFTVGTVLHKHRATQKIGDELENEALWINSLEEVEKLLNCSYSQPSGLSVTPTLLSFGKPGGIAFPIGVTETDIITIRNASNKEYEYSFFVPQEPHLFTCQVRPGKGKLKPNTVHTVSIQFSLLYTTSFHQYLKLTVAACKGDTTANYLIEIKLEVLSTPHLFVCLSVCTHFI